MDKEVLELNIQQLSSEIQALTHMYRGHSIDRALADIESRLRDELSPAQRLGYGIKKANLLRLKEAHVLLQEAEEAFLS